MSESVDQFGNGAAEQPVSRRGFFKYALLSVSGLVTAVGVAFPIVAYLWPPKQGAGAGGVGA